MTGGSILLRFRMNDFERQIHEATMAQRVDQLRNHQTRFEQPFELSLPPVEEQTAIAAVLSDMDAELAALEQRLAKTRALKQGMMQELLTGRTRLV